MGIGKVLSIITMNKDVISENTKKLKESIECSTETAKEKVSNTSTDISNFFSSKKDDLTGSFSSTKDNISEYFRNKKIEDLLNEFPATLAISYAAINADKEVLINEINYIDDYIKQSVLLVRNDDEKYQLLFNEIRLVEDRKLNMKLSDALTFIHKDNEKIIQKTIEKHIDSIINIDLIKNNAEEIFLNRLKIFVKEGKEKSIKKILELEELDDILEIRNMSEEFKEIYLKSIIYFTYMDDNKIDDDEFIEIQNIISELQCPREIHKKINQIINNIHLEKLSDIVINLFNLCKFDSKRDISILLMKDIIKIHTRINHLNILENDNILNIAKELNVNNQELLLLERVFENETKYKNKEISEKQYIDNIESQFDTAKELNIKKYIISSKYEEKFKETKQNLMVLEILKKQHDEINFLIKEVNRLKNKLSTENVG
jgi:hypothetical protein